MMYWSILSWRMPSQRQSLQNLLGVFFIEPRWGFVGYKFSEPVYLLGTSQLLSQNCLITLRHLIRVGGKDIPQKSKFPGPC